MSDDLQQRVEVLERQVDALCRGIGLIFASAKPGVECLDATLRQIGEADDA